MHRLSHTPLRALLASLWWVLPPPLVCLLPGWWCCAREAPLPPLQVDEVAAASRREEGAGGVVVSGVGRRVAGVIGSGGSKDVKNNSHHRCHGSDANRAAGAGGRQ